MKERYRIKNMKKLLTLVVSVLVCMLMVVPAFAATNDTSIIDWTKTGTITFQYNEIVEGPDPVVSAEFTAYKVANFGNNGEFISVIAGVDDDEFYTEGDDPSNILERVEKAYQSGSPEGGAKYTTKTNAEGYSEITGMDLGLYVVVESMPAVSHYESKPFFASLPNVVDNEWTYTINAEPKSNPGGDLIISKKVEGDGGDKTRAWNFLVTFVNFTQPVKYMKSTGEQGEVKNGDTVTLKDGENITIKTIPVGVAYSVEELEANKDGYTTSVTTNSTTIKRKSTVTADFVNTKYNPPTTPSTPQPTSAASTPPGTSTVNTADYFYAYVFGGIALIMLTIALIVTLVAKKKNKDE